jgi:hypothetical protein
MLFSLDVLPIINGATVVVDDIAEESLCCPF